MNGKPDPNKKDHEYIEKLVKEIDNHKSWKLQENEDLQEIIDTPIKGYQDITEVSYRHEATDGTLLVEVPLIKENYNTFTGHLNQPLDKRQKSNPETDEFLQKIIDTNESISNAHASDSENVYPESDESTILNFELPINYTDQELDEVLTVASNASKEVQKLHDEVNQVFDKYMEK